MNADHFFRSAGCLIIGVCFTLVFISITNQQWMDTNCDSINVEAIQTHLLHANITNSTAHDMHSIFDTHHCHAVNYLQPFANVFELAKIINNLDLKSGIEIGTQEGNFTQAFLKEWKKVNEYVLSDEWVVTNKSAGNPKKVLALAKLKSASLNGTAICEGTALKCATRYPDLRFDFIFIDTHVITEVGVPIFC